MRQCDIAENIGKTVRVNRARDLYMCEDMRPIIGKECQLIKQCKSGLLLVKHQDKHYSLAAYNIDPIKEGEVA